MSRLVEYSKLNAAFEDVPTVALTSPSLLHPLGIN